LEGGTSSAPIGAKVNYTFNLSHWMEKTSLFLTIKADIGLSPSVDVYNFSEASFQNWWYPEQTLTTKSLIVNTSSGFLSPDGEVILRIKTQSYSSIEGNGANVYVYDTYISFSDNPISCGFLTQGETCEIDWLVNASGSVNSAWKIDVNFTSEIIHNTTRNTTMRIIDRIPPSYSDNSTDTTLAEATSKFSLRWRDNAGLSGFIFSFDNCWGYFKNDTWDGTSWSSNPLEGWSNVTKELNSTVNCKVRWKVYANDTSNNWMVSEEYSFYTWPPAYCKNVTWELTDTVTIYENDTYWCTAKDFDISGKTAFVFAPGVHNLTFDCLELSIRGDDTPNTYGIDMSRDEIRNITVKNCKISDFYYAVYSTAREANFIDNTFNSSYHGIYLLNSNNNTLLSNEAVKNTAGGIVLESSDNNTLRDNRVNSNSIGINLSTSSYNTLTDNLIGSNSDSCIRLQDSSFNNITGGYVICNGAYDYRLKNAGTTNYFRNTNLIDPRKIYFEDTKSWFNYNDETQDGTWLKTNVSSVATITRKLINWDQSLMIWNDTNSSGIDITARYNITGLKPYKYYLVYDNSILTYILQADPSGKLPSFTIYLASRHEIKVQEDLESPRWSNLKEFPPNGTSYQPLQTYQFNVTWVDNGNISDVIFELDGKNVSSYLWGNVSREGNEYYISLTDLSGGWHVYRWYANDTNNNQNSTVERVYLINRPPKIWNLVVRDDKGELLPNNKTNPGVLIMITVNVSDPDDNVNYVEGNFTDVNDGYSEYENFTEEVTSSYTHVWNYTLHSDAGPGEAYVNVTVYDEYGAFDETFTNITINEFAEIVLSNIPINFSLAFPGEEVNATEKQGWPLNITVGGNVPLNLSQNGTDLVGEDPSFKISVRNITWNQTDKGFFNPLDYFFTRIAERYPRENQTVFYKIRIPTVIQQRYSGMINIKGEYSG
jgi:parallel beta-helix repeat protein